MRADRLADMAVFVVNLGYKPADYWALTLGERKAIIKALNRRNSR